jgi:hypothetical protein
MYFIFWRIERQVILSAACLTVTLNSSFVSAGSLKGKGLRFFAEFTLSEILRPLRFLRMTRRCRDSDLSESESWTDLKVCPYGVDKDLPVPKLAVEVLKVYGAGGWRGTRL